MDAIDRIVVIHDFSEPEGGAGILAAESIRQYRARGLPVTLITGEGDTETLSAQGVSVVGLNAQPLLEISAVQALRQGYHNKAALELVQNWIDENDTPGTVYHLHNWSQILSPAIFVALKSVAERTIVTCHDFFNVCPNGAFTHFGTSKSCSLKPGSMACFASQCDRRSHLHKVWRFTRQHHLNHLADFGGHAFTFTYIHDRMKQRFEDAGFPGQDGVTIPNPVRAWTEKRVEAENNSGFLFVGRVSSDKGADLALIAAADANQPITIIGEGDLAQSGPALYPNANFVGWKQHNEIAEIARNARALIVPSRVTEPFGLVILEAAMSGVPVIVTKSAYLAEDVERLDFGQSFQTSDPDTLRDILVEFATNDQLVERMSKAGMTSASSLCHTPESWAERFLDVFARKLEFQNAVDAR